MAIDPYKPEDLQRLYQNIRDSRQVLEPWRKNRKKLIEDYVGNYYSDSLDTNELPVVVNLINQTANVYAMSLAPQRPRVVVSTFFDELKPFSHRYKLAVNSLLEELVFEDVLREAIVDGFFCMGIIKTYMADWQPIRVQNPEYVEEPGFNATLEQHVAYAKQQKNPVPETILVDPGRPFSETISFDDWFHDTQARKWDKVKFMGDIYRLDWDKLQDPMFDQSVVRTMTSQSDRRPATDLHESERTQEIMGDIEQPSRTVVEYADVMDVYLPFEKLIVTMPVQQGVPHRPLSVREWDGAKEGPYRTLRFDDVPDNTMPSAPAQNLKFLFDVTNSLLRKLVNQAKRQKSNPIYTPAGERAANALKIANDGEWVQVGSLDEVGSLNQGGLSQENLAFSIQSLQLFDRMAGNLQAMGGLGAQAGTARQDELIHSQVSKREAKMAARVNKLAGEVAKDLGWLLWVDRFKEISAQIQIPKTEIKVDAHWRPEDRQGEFPQYAINIEPYSMQYQPPGTRSQKLMQILTQIVMPALPIMVQQGMAVNWQELLATLAELENLPELNDMFQFATPMDSDRPDLKEITPMLTGSRQGPTENIRYNVSTGGTNQARDNVLMQTLMSGGGNAPVNDQQINQTFTMQ